MKQRYIFICCFFMAANFTFAQCLQAPGGMLSWWTADGNTNDISGSNNGNLFNGASYAAGKVGQGFSFDGVDDYVQASAINLPTGNSNRTLMCWAKVNAIVTSEAFFAGYGSFGSFTQTYQIGTTTNNNLVFFSQWGQQIVGPTLQTGVWYHVAVSNTGNFTTLFLNGNVVATGNLNINTAIGTQFNIGRIPGSLGNYRRLNGMVDEVQVFDRALAQSEIQTIYNAGGAGVCKTCNITANAGPDTTIFSGQSVQIGSAPVAGNTYSWTPATGLSDANIANPLASPADSITYSLTVTNANGCSGTDEVKVIVLPVLPGSTCLNPIPLMPTNTCTPIDFTMSGNEMWFSFVADSTNIQIIIIMEGNPALPGIDSVSLYENNCSNLNLLTSAYLNETGAEINFIFSGLVPGNNYSLTGNKNQNGSAIGEVCVQNLSSNQFVPNSFANVASFTNVCGLDYLQASVRLNQRISPQIGASPILQPCSLTFANIPAGSDILAAYLWFTVVGPVNNINFQLTNPDGGIKNFTTANNSIVITANGSGTTTGNGSSSATCWPNFNDRTTSYRANVLSSVTGTLNGSYILSGLPVGTSGKDTDGATLFIVFKTPCTSSTRPTTLILYDGLDVQQGSTDQTYNMAGFSSYNNNINERGFFIVADVESVSTNPSNQTTYTINAGSTGLVPATFYSFNQDAFITLQPGANSIPFKISNNGSDCRAISVFGVYFQDGNITCNPTSSLALSTTNNYICSGQCTGSATVTVTSVNPVSSFLWGTNSGNQTSATATGLCAGTYSVTVTEGCGNTATSNVTVSQFVLPTLPPVCVSDDDFQISNCWSGPGIYASSTFWPIQKFFSPSTVGPGNFIMQYNCNCTGTTTLIVNGPTVIPTPNSQFICSNSLVNITLNSTLPNTTFNWTVTASAGITGHQSGTGTSITQMLFNNQVSPGTVTYEITATEGTCTGLPVIATVTVNPTPIATLSNNPSTICSGSVSNIFFASNVNNTTFSWTAAGQSGMTGFSPGSGTSIEQILTNNGNTQSFVIYTITPTAYGCIGDPVGTVVFVKPKPSIIATPNGESICSGKTTGIALSSNVSGTTFSWVATSSTGAISGYSNGNGNSINQTLFNSSTTPGIVNYIVNSSANDCINTSSISVTVSNSPSITSITSTKDCEGGVGDGSATVNATGGTTPYSYLWSNQQEWQTATGLISGLYSVTVTDSKGCSSTGNVTILQNNMPLPQIIGNNNDCKGIGWNSYSAYNPNPSLYGYEWSISEGTLDCSVCTATVTTWSIPPGSSGSITLSVTDFETGCQISTTMIVFSCCDENYPGNDLPLLPDPKFYNATISSVQNHIGKKIIIEGILTVNANLTFENCQVFLSPDAKIVVGPNVAFVCTTTTSDFTKRTILQAGCDIMWDGIYLASNTSALTIASNNESIPTTIMHAKNAVVSKAGGSYTIMRSKFDLNLRDIVQQNDAGSTEVIILNQFLCTGPMLPYYSGNMQLTAPRTSVGIELTDVPQINIGVTGYGNTFNNMDFGIKSINSSVTVKKNLFQNITYRQLPCCQVNGGIAIWAKGDKANNRILIVGGSSNSEQNKIMNCSVGIRAEDQINISVEKNTFDIQNLQFTPETGVLVQNCSGKNISIKTNTFTKFKVGIDCKKIALSNVLIQSNTMNNYLYPIPHICLAISVRDAIIFSMPFPPVTFGSTLISNNKITSVGRGIFLGGSNMAQIRENRINFSHLTGTTEPAQPHYGIQVTKSNNTLIAQNTVERVGMNPTLGYSTKLFGISLETSDNCSVGSNNLTKLGTGVRFFNTFAKASLLCNMMQNCQRGVTLENCDIQNQGTYNQPQDNRWVYQGGFSREADAKGVLPVTPRTWYVRDLSLPWSPVLQSPSIIATTLGNTSASINCTNPCGTANPCKQAQLLPVAENTAPFNTYPPDGQFLAKQSVFEQLRDVPGLMQMGTTDDIKLQQFHDNILPTNTGKIREVNEHISNNDLLIAKQKNDAIAPSNLMEENHKKVNDVYLRAWAVDKFEIDAADRSTLEAIAYQNPMNGGSAVYSARVMLDTILDDFAPDISARMINQYESSEMEKIVLYENYFIGKLYPNPNDGIMQLDYNLSGEHGILEIFDISGQLLKSYSLQKNETSLKINLKNFSSGVYFYKIKINNATVTHEKLVIIK